VKLCAAGAKLRAALDRNAEQSVGPQSQTQRVWLAGDRVTLARALNRHLLRCKECSR
jgi:hypothetical protein